MAEYLASADACETARLLARLGGSVFIPIIKPYLERFPSYNKHWIDALKLFLRAYAFEKAGAPKSYKEKAVLALENCKGFLDSEEASQKVWDEFKSLLRDTLPGAERNPLNPGREAPFDAVYFCKTHVAPDNQNLYLFSLRNIRANKVWKAHASLQRIRGIGPKIASLFLRNIALENGITDVGLRDRDLLQPIDVWLRRSAEQLLSPQKSFKKDCDAARALVHLADEAGCCALRLNAGCWYFGSQVAKTEQMLRADLRNPQSVTSALERHGKAAKGQLRRALEEAGFVKPGEPDPESVEAKAKATKTSPAKTAPKVKKPSLASYLTSLLLEGGNIEEIRDKANANADRLGLNKITVGQVRAHAKWRSRKGAYTVNEDTSRFIQMVPAA